ncbi:MAG TPA: BamA/TamA family outer membrane protein [Anaeromyxobacteraceae bacterium]|nr:BamA/TamA family outer membrane protein [Anaeromyxobacteraceae bacterium]
MAPGRLPSRPGRRLLAAALAAACAAAPSGARAALGDAFVDPTDGAFDASAWLASRRGFVPLIVPITEPALGFGGAGGLVFFHPNGEPGTSSTGGERPPPPSLSAALAFGTSNGSWGAGGGHMGIWRGDAIRYLGGLAYADLNLDFYGSGDAAQRFEIRSLPIVQELVFRIAGSRLYAGGRWVFARSDVRFSGTAPAGVLGSQVTSTTSGLGAVLTWDARDTIFTPASGTRAEASFLWYDPVLGGDYRYWKLHAYQLGYFPVSDSVTAALRVDGQVAGGDVPFYAVPYVHLRGIPALRYQGTAVLVAEGEVRWEVVRRWSAVGFGGAGAVDTRRADVAWNAGGGFRYLLARAFGLALGADLARGPEQWAFYVVFGNAWR